MSQNRAWRRVFPVFAVLAALVLASLPAQAAPSRHAVQRVAVPGESLLARVWSCVANLVHPGTMTKEGVTIDPNGGTGTSTVPSVGGDDEGTSIDPNGL